MIYLDIVGRCGNQMFQYAFAKRLAQIQNDEITINFAHLCSYLMQEDESFCDELCNFVASENYYKINENKNLVYLYGSKRQKRIYRIYRMVRKFYGRLGIEPHRADSQFRTILAKYGIFVDCLYRKKPFLMKYIREKNMFAKGYFEDPMYLEPIRKELSVEFKPLELPLSKNIEFYRKIAKRNSVCVSFRKWEVGGRDICDEKYYQRAFRYMLENVERPQFVVFSNDIDWVKDNFDLPEGCLFEDGTDPVWEKVRMMSNCKHFIISNSTFAWWVQYLGQSDDKIVISPKKWFDNEKKQDILILKEFVKL